MPPVPHPSTHAKAARAPAFAAIDLGTNNCRLLVAEPTVDGFRVIDSFSRIVRLGEGLAANGTLHEKAIERTVQALRVCANKMHTHGVETRMRAVGTEACRRADNGDAFKDRVLDQTGIWIESISSFEEAELTLKGCAPLLDGSKPNALVFDIGGGSTEVVWIDVSDPLRPKALDIVSLPHGVVTLTEDFKGLTNGNQGYDRIIELIDAGLKDFDARNGISDAVKAGRVQMLGTSGTVTTLGALHLGLDRYSRNQVDGITLDFDEICCITRAIDAMNDQDRAKHPCIGPKRSDLIMSGCAVLDAVTKRWPVGKLVVADRGIREGILSDLMAAHTF